YSFSCGDLGRVQIQGTNGVWQTLGSFGGYSGGTWSRLSYDLGAFAGQTVRLGFYFESHNDPCNVSGFSNPVDVAPGWYLDEVVVVTTPEDPLIPNQVE